MPKVSVLVEIPEGYELACENLRVPKPGEYFVNSYGHVFQVQNHCVVDGVLTRPELCVPSVIVRPAWKWPEWLLTRWVAMDSVGQWMTFDGSQPRMSDVGWTWGNDHSICLRLTDKILAFTPPPCTDWTQSLRENPKFKEVT